MKIYIKLVFFLLIIADLAGCAIIRSSSSVGPAVELVPGQSVQLPQPAQMELNTSATQILTAKYQIKNQTNNYTTQVQVEANPKNLTLVAVTNWGELFSINYNGADIKIRSLPMPNTLIGGQHTLVDFILIYAPADLLKKLLTATNVKLVLKPQQRIFIMNNQPLITIDYQDPNPWKGKVALRNFKYKYTISITTI
jgi:hypothetical protein